MDNTYISVAKETLLAAMEEYYASLDNHDIGQMDVQLKEAIELKNKAEKERDLAEEQLTSTRKDLEAVKAEVKTAAHNTELAAQVMQLKQQLVLVEQQNTMLKEQLKVYETSESLADYPMAAVLIRKIVESTVNSGITANNLEAFITQYITAIDAARAKKAAEQPKLIEQPKSIEQPKPLEQPKTLEQPKPLDLTLAQPDEQQLGVTSAGPSLSIPLMSKENLNKSFGFDLK